MYPTSGGRVRFAARCGSDHPPIDAHKTPVHEANDARKVSRTVYLRQKLTLTKSPTIISMCVLDHGRLAVDPRAPDKRPSSPRRTEKQKPAFGIHFSTDPNRPKWRRGEIVTVDGLDAGITGDMIGRRHVEGIYITCERAAVRAPGEEARDDSPRRI